jgi:GR25 family glycosyltransferase involved in LPS biosynthesis
MKIVCITLPSKDYKRMGGLYGTSETSGPPAAAAANRMRDHFAERGVDASFFYGLHAEKLGLRTIHPYEVDAPGSGWNMGPGPTGCWLSHRALWAALLLLPSDPPSTHTPNDIFFVLEDDARFAPDWRQRLDAALIVAPADWDLIWVGSCCTQDKPKTHVAGDLYEVKWPLCTHGYLVRRKALPVLIETQDEARCYAPIDISLTFHSMPKLRTFTILPRLLDQFDIHIPE